MVDIMDATSGSPKPEAKTRMVRRHQGVIPLTSVYFTVVLIMAITVSVLVQSSTANPTCILNCAQCVKVYGDYFDGHSCARVCIESRSRFDSFVDCADPTTIARFLKSY